VPRQRLARPDRPTIRAARFGTLFGVGAALFALGGAIFGFVRGLSYLPTLPAAIVEGAVLVGVPGTVLAAVVAAAVTTIARLHRGPRVPSR
jgi:uncharacterized membrane protein YedE/YeeE